MGISAHVERCAGVDLDTLCGYTTARTLLIRDRRLGFLLFGLQFVIFLYVVVYQVLLQQVYSAVSDFNGVVRLQLKAPAPAMRPMTVSHGAFMRSRSGLGGTIGSVAGSLTASLRVGGCVGAVAPRDAPAALGSLAASLRAATSAAEAAGGEVRKHVGASRSYPAPVVSARARAARRWRRTTEVPLARSHTRPA